jgi:hypothetical protein
MQSLQFSDDPDSSLTPSRPRNSIPCSSNTRRIAWRFRTCIGGVPLVCSPREIADCETLHWSDNLRTDHFSNVRAARSCAPVIGGLEVNSLSELLSSTDVHADCLAERTTCLWPTGFCAKQEMLLLLADEVRPCSVHDDAAVS